MSVILLASPHSCIAPHSCKSRSFGWGRGEVLCLRRVPVHILNVKRQSRFVGVCLRCSSEVFLEQFRLERIPGDHTVGPPAQSRADCKGFDLHLAFQGARLYKGDASLLEVTGGRLLIFLVLGVFDCRTEDLFVGLQLAETT